MLIFKMLVPDDHNEIMLNLLFDVTVWHAYTKFRIHTEDTLALFDIATTILG